MRVANTTQDQATLIVSGYCHQASRYQPTPDHDGEALPRMVRGGESSLIPRLKRVAQPGWRLLARRPCG